jgi:uncharacterized metal-binding protein YceD (DUF177 family)
LKTLDQYIIPFSGLGIGRHTFDLEVRDEFFACFEASEISNGELSVKVVLDKSSTMLDFHIAFSGTVRVPCDLCTEDFDMVLEGEEQLIAKFGDEEFTNTDDIVVLPHGEYQIQLAQYIYEFIHLALPARRVHPEGECDPEMLSKLNELGPRDEPSTDPRWDMLKNIKLN